MPDETKLVARAIVGSAYLLFAAILSVGMSITFVNDPGPEKGFYFFMAGILLIVIIFFVGGVKTLTSVLRESKA